MFAAHYQHVSIGLWDYTLSGPCDINCSMVAARLQHVSSTFDSSV